MEKAEIAAGEENEKFFFIKKARRACVLKNKIKKKVKLHYKY